MELVNLNQEENMFNDVQSLEGNLLLMQTMLRDLGSVPQMLQDNLKEIGIIEKAIMDIEHILELTTFSASEGFVLAREIKKARKRRRELKDINELLAPMVKAANNIGHANMVRCMSNGVEKVQEVQSKHKDRLYNMRVRKDLAFYFKSEVTKKVSVIK